MWRKCRCISLMNSTAIRKRLLLWFAAFQILCLPAFSCTSNGISTWCRFSIWLTANGSDYQLAVSVNSPASSYFSIGFPLWSLASFVIWKRKIKIRPLIFTSLLLFVNNSCEVPSPAPTLMTGAFSLTHQNKCSNPTSSFFREQNKTSLVIQNQMTDKENFLSENWKELILCEASLLRI